MFWFVLNWISYFIRRFRRKHNRPAIAETRDSREFADGGRRVFPVGPEWRTPGKRLRTSPRKGLKDQPPETFFTRSLPGNGRARRESFVEVEGNGKSVAVLTSGGDAQGKYAFQEGANLICT